MLLSVTLALGKKGREFRLFDFCSIKLGLGENIDVARLRPSGLLDEPLDALIPLGGEFREQFLLG